MTRDEIIKTMLGQESFRIFRTMQLGGNTRQLEQMEREGLISSESRYGGRHRQRNWFCSDTQWKRHHDQGPHTSEILTAAISTHEPEALVSDLSLRSIPSP